jgi:multidrug efflux pump
VAAGSLDTGAGRLAVKVPGVIENLDDVLGLPIKVEGDRVVTFGDVAVIHRDFKDPAGFARINGEPGVVLEVSKRAGANIINTIAQVKALLEQAGPLLPEGVEVHYIMDQSIQIETMLSDLLNNVLTAVVLVLILIVATMGLRSAVMVGLTIPGAFLAGILVIWAIGFTMNIIVLFSLILVAGMLVDGAIVVSELADRNLHDGQNPRQAWVNAAHRMSWPVIASTATTLAVFVPLLFWPGVVGEFMKYLPATVIICLLASLAMALVFLPTMGGVSRHRPRYTQPVTVPGLELYRAVLSRLLRRPGLTLAGTLAIIALMYAAYARFNHGVEFFPDIEPDSAQLQVRARGDLSVYEKDAILREVERRLQGLTEVKALYARSFAMPDGQMGTDVIGVLQFQFTDWHRRRPASAIKETMTGLTRDIPGVVLEFREQQMGPGAGKPVELRVSGTDERALSEATERIRAAMLALGGFADIEDDRTLPGIEWRIRVDREAAARLGADVLSVGNAVQLVTNGLKLASYRPEDASDEVDIRVRLPQSWRSLDQFSRLSLNTQRGQVPLSHFVTLSPAPKIGTLHRVDGRRTITIQADIAEGYRLDERLAALAGRASSCRPGSAWWWRARTRSSARPWSSSPPPSGGGVPDGDDAGHPVQQPVPGRPGAVGDRLVHRRGADGAAGQRPVLRHRHGGHGHHRPGRHRGEQQHRAHRHLQPAARRACRRRGDPGNRRLRLRPVLLTAITTVLGLMPMVLGLNVDLLGPASGSARRRPSGGPSCPAPSPAA